LIGKKTSIHSLFNATFTCHFVFQDSIEKSKRAIGNVSLTEKKV
jgi:hypothetical protein